MKRGGRRPRVWGLPSPNLAQASEGETDGHECVSHRSARGDTWRIHPQPGVAPRAPRSPSSLVAHPQDLGALLLPRGRRSTPLDRGAPPLPCYRRAPPSPAAPRSSAPSPSRAPALPSLSLAGPMLLSGAPPAGSGPGPRAQGSAGGGPGGSRRGAGSAGTGPGGGGSGGVAKWLREHLGFRGGGGGGGGGKPAPPEPDYRPPTPCPAAPPAPPPDILAAYRLQRERDFEDPYSGGSSGSTALATPAAPGPTPPPRHGSPPHRLIRVETPGPPAPPPDERLSGPPASSDRVSASPGVGGEVVGGLEVSRGTKVAWPAPGLSLSRLLADKRLVPDPGTWSLKPTFV
jgi:hypothetical protein